MGYTIPINIYLSEVQWQIIKDYEINILEVVVDAIKDAIDSRSVMKNAVLQVSNSRQEIEDLKSEVNRLEMIIKRKKMYPMIEVNFRRTTMKKDAAIEHPVYEIIDGGIHNE
jgi:hypothetical protein